MLALHGWRRDHHDFDLVLGGEPESDHGATLVGEGATPSARSSTDDPLPPGPLDALALDLPGFGATPPPETCWGAKEYAAAVAEVLGEMAAPVVVVGHSFGARVAVELAAEEPGRVGALVLTGAPLFPAGGARRRPPTRYRVARALARSGIVGEDRIEAMRQRYGSSDYKAATGVMREVLVRAIAETNEEAYSPALAAIRCPVELVWGALDTAAPPRVAERIAHGVGDGSRLSVSEGIGHLTPLQIPGRLRLAVERVLE